MRHFARILTVIVLMIALCASAIAQTSTTSTPTTNSPTVREETRELARETRALRRLTTQQTISRLLAEVSQSRTLIATYRARVAALETELAAEQRNGQSLQTSNQLAGREIELLRSAITHLENSIAAHERTILILQTELARSQNSARRWRKRFAVAAAIAGGLAALVFGR